METSSSEPPIVSPNPTPVRSGCYRVLLGTFLILFPPIGFVMLVIKNPWPKRQAIIFATASALWICFLAGQKTARPSPSIPTSSQNDSAQEFADFKIFVDEALDVRSAITDLEDYVASEKRSGTPVSTRDFHQESLALRDQIETLQKQYRLRFGSEIGEYRTQHHGRNDKLFLSVSEAVNRLHSVWLEWSSVVARGGRTQDLEMHDRLFWQSVDDARSLLVKNSSPASAGGGKKD